MSTFLQIIGGAAVVTGVAFIFWPAAVILAGAAIFAVGFLTEGR